MSESLFAPATTIDPAKDYTAELVGDGKKFKTVADLARGKAESDLFILQQQQENAELRAELSRRKAVEDAIAAISTTNNSSNSANSGNAQDAGSASNQVALGDEELNTRIRNQIDGLFKTRSEEQVKENNLNVVRSTLESVWGKDYSQRLSGVAEELGASQEYLMGIAQTQPKAFLKLVGAEQKSPASASSLFSPSSAGVTSAGLANQTASNLPETERYSYWKKIRKENPNYYHSIEAANKRFEAIKKHGDAFLTT